MPEVSVIVPTRNEADNVQPLLDRLACARAGGRTEVVFVDDSDDATPSVIRRVGEEMADRIAVRSIHRRAGERAGGLGSAVVMGLRVARAPWVCVMDADLQHPPELVPELLTAALARDATLVVASRYAGGGDANGLSSRSRVLVSGAASAAAKLAFARRLRDVTDPMSGFFLVRRDSVDPDALRPQGFKILLEIIVRSDHLRVVEVGYEFGVRSSGASKAGLKEGIRFVSQVGRLLADNTRSASQRRARRLRSVGFPHNYDIHGILRVESQGTLPELEAFRVDALTGAADVSVRIGALSDASAFNGSAFNGSARNGTAVNGAARKGAAVNGAVRNGNPFHSSMRYAEVGNLGFGADIDVAERVEVRATQLLARSPHVLYTNVVEPILRWEFVRRGYALVHGACVVDRGEAFLITARTDTGKTTTMLKLLDDQPFEFVSDDLTLISSNGRVLPYPKPLTISSHTLQAVKRHRLTYRERATLPVQSRLHSRSGRRLAFLLSKMRLPAATINTVAQLVIPPPKYAVQRLVPGVQVATDGTVKGVIVIHRSDDSLEWLDCDTTLDIVLSNTEDAYGFPPYHRIENFLLGASSQDLRSVERQIIAGALEDTSAAMVASSTYDWVRHIPMLMEEMSRRARSVTDAGSDNPTGIAASNGRVGHEPRTDR